MTIECVPESLVTITQGADKTFFINLTIKEGNNPAKAFKLEPAPTQVQVRFPSTGTGNVLRLELGAKVIVDEADGGILKIVMPEADSLVLVSQEDKQDIEVKVVQNIPDAGTTKFFLFESALLVKAQRFPETP